MLSEQANISVFDPKVVKERIYADIDALNTRTEQENIDLLTVEKDPYLLCKDAHAIAILTEWDEFKGYNWNEIYNSMQKPAFIFDGRGLLDQKKLEAIGFKLFVIGLG